MANVFEEAGLNPPKKIEVDRPHFDKLLSESITLYNIDTKEAISERKFSISDLILIAEDRVTIEDLANSNEEDSKQKQDHTKYGCLDCRPCFICENMYFLLSEYQMYIQAERLEEHDIALQEFQVQT